ncbi:MAG: 5/3-nucleotidase SurE [Myxococcaceae bacterium]|nr:5/3-nucleotidase SurE [Myxococcaceae bacterium]
MKLLLTNDDGIDAVGLSLLAGVCASLGEVTVVAPHEEQSGVGHRVSTRHPLKLEPRVFAGREQQRCYSLAGSPADCARVGLRGLAVAADWVLSGLNHGGNLGVDVNMSGTVAGAREGAILGCQAIAISQVLSVRHPVDPERMRKTTERVLRELMGRPLPPGQLYNVNLPFAPESEEPALVLCAPDPSPHDVRFDEVDGGWQYTGKFLNRPRERGLDVDVVFAGKIAVSVLTVV